MGGISANNMWQITPETDPRPVYHDRTPSPPDLVDLRDHYPWQHDDSDPGDPEEADIEEVSSISKCHFLRGSSGLWYYSIVPRCETMEYYLFS